MCINSVVISLFILVLLICLIGFKRYVYFISIGYGFSIAAIGLALMLMYRGVRDVKTIAYCAIMGVYGLRLGGYITYREFATGYNARMKGEIKDGSGMSFIMKALIWVSCALLYIMMTAPLIYRCTNGAVPDSWLIAGIVISTAGIIIESVSDTQKSNAKKENPGRFCDTGLYRFVRCPNYLGELIIWTGMFLSSFGAVLTASQFTVSVIGYLGIVYIMFSGARRLEIRQDKNYGADPEYIAYKASTPILIPFIPLYSVKKHTWLVG